MALPRSNRGPALAAAADAPLFSDAEPREDLAEQVVGGELAGDFRQRILCDAQFLGEELDRRRRDRNVLLRSTEVRRGLRQSAHLSLAREIDVLGRMLGT